MQKRYLCFLLAFSLLTLIVILKDFPTLLLEPIANRVENPELFYKLGDWSYKGIGLEHNLKKAEQWYLKAAKRNHAKAMYKLGNLYSHRHGIQKGQEVEAKFWKDVPLDYEQAIKWYTCAGELGDVGSYIRLGYFHLNGIGMPTDYKKSFFWYSKAAKTGNKTSQGWLGYFYSHGIDREIRGKDCSDYWNGIEKNYQKALKWYQRAARQGAETAQYMVGFMYSHGAMNNYEAGEIILEIPGIKLDYSKAVKWFTRAAQQGHKIAHRKLGFLYLHGGWGLEKNPKEALRWYTQGARNDDTEQIRKGDAVCMRRVGVCYGQGIGVEQNDAKALEWYSRAIKEGDKRAEEYLDEFAHNAADYFAKTILGDSQKNAVSAEIIERFRTDFYNIFKANTIVFPYSSPKPL